MKLIKILALVAASAVLASGQTTGSTGTSTQGTSANSQSKTDQKKPANGKTSPATKSTQKSGDAGPVKLVEKKNTPASAGAQSGSTKTGSTGAATTSGKAPGSTATKPAAQTTTTSKGTAQGSTATSKTGNATGTKTGSATATKTGNTTSKTGNATATKTGQKKPVVTEKKGSVASKAAKPVQAKSKPAQPKVVEKKNPPAGKPAAAVINSLAKRSNRRDPFLSPIKPVGPVVAQRPGCSTGKRCLYIPELILKGTAKDTEGKMVAVVSNPTQRTYFLRENDQVFNGNVQKITADSVIFREFTTDNMGRESAHEVVKRMTPGTQGPG